MKPYVLALLTLSACGGGGASSGSVVEIAFGDPVVGLAGECSWSDSDTTITIERYYESEFYQSRRDSVLRHELWHAMTRIESHSRDSRCISSSPSPVDLSRPCEDERVEVLSSALVPIKARFSEDCAALERAAAWWNEACGQTVIEVVP